MNIKHFESFNDLSVAEAIKEAEAKTGQVELATSHGFWDSDEFYEEYESSSYDYFEKKATEYSSVLGEPTFRGSHADPGFPDNYEEQFGVHADFLVTWKYNDQTYGLAIVQPDREIPFIVTFQKIPQ